MMYIIYWLLALFCFLDLLKSQKKDYVFSLKSIYYIWLLVLFILTAFRWECGTDWMQYKTFFEDPSRINSFEAGFTLYVKIIRSIINDFSAYIFVGAILIVSCLNISIIKISHFPLLSLLIFLAQLNGGIFFVRQHLAIVILLVSTYYVIKRRLIYFIILLVLATSIHRTSFLFILAYPIYNISINNKKKILFLFLGGVIAVLLGKILFTSSIFNLFGGIIAEKINSYSEYAEMGMTFSKYSATELLIRGFCARLIIIIAILYFLRRRIGVDKICNGLVNIYLMGTIVYLLTVQISTSFARGAAPFDTILIFIIPYVLIEVKKKYHKYPLFLFITCYFFFKLYVIISDNLFGDIYSYHSILER